MTNNDQPANPQALRCPSCGAALPDGGNRVECAFCGTVVDLRRQREQSKQQPHQPQQPGGTVWRSPSVTVVQTRRKSVNAGGCLGPLLIVIFVVPIVFVAGLLWFVGVIPGSVTRTSGPSLPSLQLPIPPSLRATSAAMLIEPEAQSDEAPQILALVNDQSDSKYHLALLEQRDRSIVWLGPALSDQALSYAHFAITPDAILFADERNLLAHNRSDGTSLWSAELSDRLCDDCLVVAGETAVALGIDNRLSGIDLASGEIVWTQDLDSSTSDRLLVYDDQVIVFTDNEENDGEIRLLDPETGNVEQSFVPSCPGVTFPDNLITASPSNPQWFDLESGRVVLASYSTDTCVHAYSLSSGEQLWANVPEEAIFSLTSEAAFADAGDRLLIGSREVLLAVNLADGELRTLQTDDEFNFHPLIERDGIALVIAVRQRGTQRAELWGVRASDGKRLWRHEFPGAGQMIGPPFDGAGTINQDAPLWTWVSTPNAFSLVSLSAQPHRFTIESIDPQSGQVTITRTIDRPEERVVWVPDLITRRGAVLYLEQLGRLLAIDTATGELIYEGP